MIRDLDKDQITTLSRDFAYNKPDPTIQRHGYLTQDEFLEICDWKSSRPRTRYRLNDANDIEEITRLAFRTRDEAVQMKLLLALHGVGVAVASTLLHWGHQEGPIIDFRSWWTVFDEDRSIFNSKDWLTYISRMRAEAAFYQVTPRTLDRAVWQYSTDHQPQRRRTL